MKCILQVNAFIEPNYSLNKSLLNLINITLGLAMADENNLKTPRDIGVPTNILFTARGSAPSN